MDIKKLPEQIVQLHKNSILNWNKEFVFLKENGFLRLVEENHAYNFKLWKQEDLAREDDKGFEHVYKAKREIDKLNQLRNNYMEQMDVWLSNSLNPPTAKNIKVNSETPGMIIDRLSILALKIYYMQLQLKRTDATKEHLASCEQRLQTLNAQHQQLQLCLYELLDDIVNNVRTFRIYYQFKMYNDDAYKIKDTIADV